MLFFDNRSSIEKILAVILCVLFFFNFRPYFMWDLSNSEYKISVVLYLVISFVYFYFHGLSFSRYRLFGFLFYTLFVLFSAISSQGISLLNLFTLVIFSLVFFTPTRIVSLTVIYVTNCYAIMGLVSVVTYFCVVAGLDISWSELSSLNSVKEYNYRNYITLVAYQGGLVPLPNGGFIFRFSGLFDEPGIVGTISALLLAVNGASFSKWQNKVILLSGILSMSLAFYLLLAILLMSKISIRIITLSLLILVVFSIIFPKGSNVILDRYVYDRAYSVIYDTGSVNNRTTDEFDNEFERYIATSNILLGEGRGMAEEISNEGFSFKYFIYNYGLVAFLAINFIYIIFSFSSGFTKNNLVFYVILSLCLLQRPYYDHISIMLLVLYWSERSRGLD